MRTGLSYKISGVNENEKKQQDICQIRFRETFNTQDCRLEWLKEGTNFYL